MKNILITGATGWIGSALASRFESDTNYSVVYCSRKKITGHLWRQLPDLTHVQSIDELFQDIHVVVHTAARAHQPQDNAASTEYLYDTINSQATLSLASAAARAGVQDFIFFSSIKAVGDSTTQTPFNENSVPHPTDAYGRSKLQAEKKLLELANTTKMRIHILRLPLVISASAKGNLERLEKLLRKRLPLPFASINNQRSFLSLPNLIDATLALAGNPPPKSDIYCLSDDEPLSTPQLIRALSSAISCPATLWHCPPMLLKMVFRLIDREPEWERLAGSLTVCNSKFKQTLNWQPPITSSQAFIR